jgi:hypothetical protein
MRGVILAAATAILAVSLAAPARAGEQCWYGPLGVQHCDYVPGEPSFYPVPPSQLGYGPYYPLQ